MPRLLASLLLPLAFGCVGDAVKPTDDSGGTLPGTDAVDRDGDGYTADEECDDAQADVNPGAVEICDGIDNDCDEDIDEDEVDEDEDDGYSKIKSLIERKQKK